MKSSIYCECTKLSGHKNNELGWTMYTRPSPCRSLENDAMKLVPDFIVKQSTMDVHLYTGHVGGGGGGVGINSQCE